MSKKIYAVMGATGQIGHVLTEELLKRGHTVRALGRDKSKLELLKTHGADIVKLKNYDNEADLIRFFSGADAAFTLIPPDYTEVSYSAFQDRVGTATTEALKKSKISHIVNLSSMGAELQQGTGVVKGLYRQEQRLNKLKDTNILHLRPGYFMENLFHFIPSIKQRGGFGLNVQGDRQIVMIATKDIGAKAAEFLDKLTFKGHTAFDLTGPKLVSFNEAAIILGKAIGNPNLKYLTLKTEEYRKVLLGNGMNAELVDLLVELGTAMDSGKIANTQELSAEHKGKTTLENFGKIFADAFQHGDAASQRNASLAAH